MLLSGHGRVATGSAGRSAVLAGGRIVLQGGRKGLLANGVIVRHRLGIAAAA